MSKLSFRARALDPSKPMPIYLAEELPDLPEYSAINRAVPQMPSGMEKEEESEHHLQRAICAGLLIPTPEVTSVDNDEFYDRIYPEDYKQPRQMIHMQPLGMDQDIPDYDIDSADEIWIGQQSQRMNIDVNRFEQMMDKLEKSSGQTVVTLNEAKALLKQDDEISIAVYDYWLNKRLTTQHPLILSVRTENRGNMAPNNPYLAFRRRTEKMQTRKNRKNDETSYEKMLKLRRDLSRAVSLLELVKRRETTKRTLVQTTVDILEKRYTVKDFSGQLVSDIASSMARNSRSQSGSNGSRFRPAPIYSNQYHHGSLASSTNLSWASGHHQNSGHLYNSGGYGSGSLKQYHHHRDLVEGGSSSRKEKRQYKKRKHKLQKEKVLHSLQSGTFGGYGSATSSHHSLHHHHPHHHSGSGMDPMISSDEDELNGTNAPGSESEDEGLYAFKRNRNCNYHKPTPDGQFGNWPWAGRDENGKADKKYRFTLTSIRHPRPRCIGFARRRMGRGGRIALDRCSTQLDDIWSGLDYTIFDSARDKAAKISSPATATSTVEDDRLETHPIPPATPVATLPHQLTAGRVSSIRLSSATSDGTASPLSYLGTPLATNRVSSLSNVISSEAATSGPSEIVIKEEQLDDYERLIDSVRNNTKNASSGITVAPSSNREPLVVSGSSSSSSSLQPQQQQQQRQHFSTPSGRLSSSYSSEFVEYAVKTETPSEAVPRLSTTDQPHAGLSQNESRDSGISMKSEAAVTTEIAMTDTGDGIYDEFLSEIEQSWLHFRPRTPVSPAALPSDDEHEAMSRLLSSGPFTVELQALDAPLPKHLFADETEESCFVTSEPLALDQIFMDEREINKATPSPELGKDEVNTSSGDSLNELSLGLSDTNEDEKLLANILEECQMEDGKALSQTSNFWNGLLEDNVFDLEETPAAEPKFDKTVGFSSDILSTFSREPAGSKTARKRRLLPSRTGHSHFKVASHLAVAKQVRQQILMAATSGVLVKEEPSVPEPATSTSSSSALSTGIIKIKSEPQDEGVPTAATVMLQQVQVKQEQQISSADATASHDYAASPTTSQIVQIIGGQTATAIRTPQQKMQTYMTTGDATAVFPTATAMRQVNGPAVLQNLLRATYQQKNQKLDDPNNPVIVDSAKINMLKSKPEANHNASQQQQQQFGIIHHQNALPPQIAIIGSAQGGQGSGPNRIFLASTPQPSTSTVDGKIHINAAGQQQITTLTSIPNAAIIVDSSNAKGGTTTSVVDGKGQQQRLKFDKMYAFDADKQRILYTTTNFKNNRGGTQLLTHLNASKVVNIVPIHSGKNNIITAATASSGQGPTTTATVLRNKATGDIIQRVTTLNNAQNIRPSNNGGKMVGMVTSAGAASSGTDPKILQADGINTTTR